MDPVVHARRLSRRYGRSWALREVDLELRAGEAVALLGANGAGKSTLLTILATLQQPSSGSLRWFGKSYREGSDSIRGRIGYVGHATLLDDALTAQENLLFYADLFAVERPREIAARRLDQMGLSARAQDRVEGFSRGMRQRLSLARALLHEPPLLILDEPFTGLDAPGCRDLAQELEDEKKRGRTLILATHQLDPVLPWCDRVFVLHRGRPVEEGPAALHDSDGWAMHLTEIAEDRTP